LLARDVLEAMNAGDIAAVGPLGPPKPVGFGLENQRP